MHARDLITADDLAAFSTRHAMVLAKAEAEEAALATNAARTLALGSSARAVQTQASLDEWSAELDSHQASLHAMRRIPLRVDDARRRHGLPLFAVCAEAADFAPGCALSVAALEQRFDAVTRDAARFGELLQRATRDLAQCDHAAATIESRCAKIGAWCARCRTDADAAAAGAALGRTPASTAMRLTLCRALQTRLEARAEAAAEVAQLLRSIGATYDRRGALAARCAALDAALAETSAAVLRAAAATDAVYAINVALHAIDAAYVDDASALVAALDAAQRVVADTAVELAGGEAGAAIPAMERTLAALQRASSHDAVLWEGQLAELAARYAAMAALVEGSDVPRALDGASVLAGRLAVGELRARCVAVRDALAVAEAESVALLAALRADAEHVLEDGAKEYSAAFDDLAGWIEASVARFQASIDALAAHHDCPQTPVAIGAALEAWTAEELPTRRAQLQSLTTIVHGINAHMHRHERGRFVPGDARVVGALEAQWETMAAVTSQLRSLIAARQLAAQRYAFVLSAIDKKQGLLACWLEEQEGAALASGEGEGALPPPTPLASQRRASLDVLREIARGGDAAAVAPAPAQDAMDADDAAGSGAGAAPSEGPSADGGEADAAADEEQSALERAVAEAALIESSIVRGELLGQRNATFVEMLAEVEAQQTELAERLAETHDASARAALQTSTAASTDLAARLAAVSASMATRATAREAELQRLQNAVRRARASADVAATLLHELDHAMLDARVPLAEATEKLAEQVRGAAKPAVLAAVCPTQCHVCSPPRAFSSALPPSPLQLGTVRAIAASTLPGFALRIAALETTLGAAGNAADGDDAVTADSQVDATAETLALMRPAQRPVALQRALADAESMCGARCDEIADTIERKKKQDALRRRFADVARLHVEFTAELTVLAGAHARGESPVAATARAGGDGAEEEEDATEDDSASNTVGAAVGGAVHTAVGGDDNAAAADGREDGDAMFEDERAGELRRRLAAVARLERRAHVYADGPFAALQRAHVACEEAGCAADNHHTSETMATLRMRWEELLRVVERSRTSIASSLEALQKAGLTNAQIKDVRAMFKSFASAPRVARGRAGSGAEVPAESDGAAGAAADAGDAARAAGAAEAGVDEATPVTVGGARGADATEAERGVATLSVLDFMNAATALGISLPSDAAAVAPVFTRYVAEKSTQPESSSDGGGERMTLEQFAKFVRDKLGASATKEDVLRALEALAEEEGGAAEGTAADPRSQVVSLEAMRGVCQTEELLSFVLGVYDEARGGAGGQGDGATVQLNYRMLASALFAV